MREEAVDEDGLFRPTAYRGILQKGDTVSDLTPRSIDRINIILEAIQKDSVIDDKSTLLRVNISCCD